MYYWIKNNYLYFFGYFLVLLFILFFIINALTGSRSVLHLWNVNQTINLLNYELQSLENLENKLVSKIKLLNNNTLDPDYISELAQKKLGLIQQNSVVIKLD